jgi:hypothetical protein
MSILSESITIGLLLALVFGALFFYIYSRVTYVEKRVGLMENILLDIKMNQEQMPANFPQHIPPNINFHDISRVPIVANPPSFHQEVLVEESFDKPLNIDPVSEEMYTSILNDAHDEVSKEENNTVAPKLTVNYESMTKEELIEVAKSRGLRVTNKPGREKLLQLIRKSENNVEGASSFEPLQEAVELDG